MPINQPFDDTAKIFYQRFFEQLGMRAIPQYGVFSRSRSIDLVVECSADDRAVLQDTVFAHFRSMNALEFKGIHDPLNAVDFNLIMMRAWGIGAVDDADKEIATELTTPFTRLNTQTIAEMPDQRTVTIVCIARPNKVLDTLRAQFHFELTAEPGIYSNQARELPAWIIHPTELALKPINYALLPLARGKKLEQFIELCMAQGLVAYLQLTLDIGLLTDPDVIWRKIMEVYDMELTIHEETWPYIDEFFRRVPEAMRKVPTFQEALAESEQRGKAEGILLAQQRTLIHVLQHKFGAISARVVQLIENQHDAAQLDKWLDQALHAETLTEMNFTLEQD